MAQLLVQTTGAVCVLTLSNPDKRNALTRQMLTELVAALPSQAASSTQPIRAVVLRGDPAGKTFSAGYDIGAIDATERKRGLDPILRPANAIERCPVPVIAALDGAAFGGALELVMACHVRIARQGIKLCMPPAKLGLVYSPTGMARFLRAVSPGTAAKMFLTGSPLLAEEAAPLGLVDEVVPDAFERASAVAEQIANNAPLAVAGLLRSIVLLSQPSGPTAVDFAVLEADRARTVASEDLQEGVAAFQEKRAPMFTGK